MVLCRKRREYRERRKCRGVGKRESKGSIRRLGGEEQLEEVWEAR